MTLENPKPILKARIDGDQLVLSVPLALANELGWLLPGTVTQLGCGTINGKALLVCRVQDLRTALEPPWAVAMKSPVAN